MWLFTRYGFFSIACARQADGSADPDTVLIRARRKAHLQNLQSRFPILAAEIAAIAERECRYRIVVSKAGWTAAVAALAEEQTCRAEDAADAVDALQRAWDGIYGFDASDQQRVLIERSEDGAITNAVDLIADDVAGEKVLCPECGLKVFASWPEGWDGHAGYACGVAGGTPEERKANYKEQYRRLFR